MLTADAVKTVHDELECGEQLVCDETPMNVSSPDSATATDRTADGQYLQ